MAFRKKQKSFAGQRRQSPLLNHRVLLAGGALALVALFLLGQFGDSGFASWWKLKAEEAKLEQEVTELEEANTRLENHLDKLATDPETLEKLAREKHNMHREGEEVLKVLDRTEPPPGVDD